MPNGMNDRLVFTTKDKDGTEFSFISSVPNNVDLKNLKIHKLDIEGKEYIPLEDFLSKLEKERHENKDDERVVIGLRARN